jgi:hypothetical protein
MRWIDGEELGCGELESKGTRKGWLEKVLIAGQVPRRVVVPIIIIICFTGAAQSIKRLSCAGWTTDSWTAF